MIIIDQAGHMVSTESEEELHAFAIKKLKMSRTWYQDHDKHPHYDLTTPRIIQRAIRLGVTQVSAKELVRQAWWTKDDANGSKMPS